jgi:hypothetical protein
MVAWWIEVGAALLGASIVVTVTIDQLMLARSEDARGGDRLAFPDEPLGRLRGVLSRIPRDIISLVVIALIVVGGLLAIRHQLFGTTKGIPIASGSAVVEPAGAKFRATNPAAIPTISDSAYSPLPKDFSINRPPWCPACIRQQSRRPAD